MNGAICTERERVWARGLEEWRWMREEDQGGGEETAVERAWRQWERGRRMQRITKVEGADPRRPPGIGHPNDGNSARRRRRRRSIGNLGLY